MLIHFGSCNTSDISLWFLVYTTEALGGSLHSVLGTYTCFNVLFFSLSVLANSIPEVPWILAVGMKEFLMENAIT